MTICEHCLHERLCKAEKGVVRCMSFESAWYPAEKAVEVFGAERQKLVAIGEMGELMTAISDHERGRKTVQDIADEIADVEQVLEELKIIYGIKRDVLLAKPRKATKLALEIVKELEKRDAGDASGGGLENLPEFPADEFAWGKIDFEFEKKIRQRIKEEMNDAT